MSSNALDLLIEERYLITLKPNDQIDSSLETKELGFLLKPKINDLSVSTNINSAKFEISVKFA